MFATEEELKRLLELYKDVKYPSKWLHIGVGDGKYIWGVMGLKDNDNILVKTAQYRTLYQTVENLDVKIKVSFDIAIQYLNSDVIKGSFEPTKAPCQEEKIVIYYLENALFRISSLWDILAQFYNLLYNLKMDPQRLDCGKVFRKERKTEQNEDRDGLQRIQDYLNQPDDTNCESPWKGNHKYMKDMRNQMTHRNLPSISSASNFGFVLRDHPLFILKRLVEDYCVVSRFILEIMDKVEQDVENEWARQENFMP